MMAFIVACLGDGMLQGGGGGGGFFGGGELVEYLGYLLSVDFS